MEQISSSGQNQSFNSEKLQLIQLLLITENPSIIQKVKELLTKNLPNSLTKQEVLDRANNSEVAFQNGKVISIDKLEDEVKNW